MMPFITNLWILDLLCAALGGTFIIYLNFLLRTRKHWIRKKLPSEIPRFFFGNTTEANVTKRISDVIDELYFKHKDKRLIGVWLYVKPVLIITDVELMKDILVKNFSHFHDRGIALHEELEPLTAHLFNVSGQQWRNLRVKLAPTFTSGKMKMMFETMLEVAMQLQNSLKEHARKAETIEIKEIMACFTTDVISSCAFGVEAKSMEDSNSNFRHHGRNLFNFGFLQIVALVMNFVAPKLQKLLRLQQFPKESCEFFLNVVKDVINYREKNNVQRKDFMNLLIELKNKGRLTDVDCKTGSDDLKNGPSADLRGEEFTVVQAAAQLFVFFIAGFETSSTTLTCSLYELAMNPEIQEKLQAEIDNGIKKNGGKIDYNVVQDMSYLDCVVQETLRKYPPVPMAFRECTSNFVVPGTDMVIERGDSIVIPISAVQSDPEYFPDPEKFDPERFSSEGKAGRDPFLNLAFGSGPRVCIGARFGLLQVKVALTAILSKYQIHISAKTPFPVSFEPSNFFPKPIGGIHLKISTRSDVS